MPSVPDIWHKKKADRIPHGHMLLQLSTLSTRNLFEPSVHRFSANHVRSFCVCAQQGTEEDINSAFPLIEFSNIAANEKVDEASNQHKDTKMKLLCALLALSFSFATCKVVKFKDCGSECFFTLFELSFNLA